MPVSPQIQRAVLHVSLLASAWLLASCSSPASDEAAPDASASAVPSAFPVATVPVQMRDIARGVLASGAVAPVEDMQLGVEISGLRVTDLLVDVGEQVRRGQVLLRLDHRMLDSELGQAEAALREAEAGAALARANLARGERLAGERFISAMQLDELRAARTQSEARVGTARAMRDTAALRRSFAELRAPAAGIVSRRRVQPGQVVAAGSELLGLIRDGRLEWRAELPVNQLTAISPGDRVVLRDGQGKQIEGRVRAVSPGVEAASRTGTVYADLPDATGLPAGAYLEGRIDTGRAQAATVPTAAVVLRDGFSTVYTVETEDGVRRARAHRVSIGAHDAGVVELLEGPPAGREVVLKGAGFLADGDAVRVVDATAGPSKPSRPSTPESPAAGTAR